MDVINQYNVAKRNILLLPFKDTPIHVEILVSETANNI
jgi:hypothetical protein